MTSGGGTITFLKKGHEGGGGAAGAEGAMGLGNFSLICGSRVAIEGRRPKSAAVVGKAAAREGGRVGGLEECWEEGPDPTQSGVVV